MSCLILLSATASQADFDAAFAAAPKSGECVALIPDHFHAPEGLAVMKTNGQSATYLAQLRCSVVFALRPQRVIGDAVALLEAASVADLFAASATVVDPMTRKTRRALEGVYQRTN